jgi:8-oxo-dGTP pyrophosphatase MutT (NUDIX family)
MPEWLQKALDSWPLGWDADQDAAYQQDLKIRKTMKEALKKMPVSHDNYESALLNKAERDGFHAASIVMINQDRALMLFLREGDGRIYLDLPGGHRACIAEDAWGCARREALEETGGKAELPTTPPASVAWEATTKQAVFVYDTSDELLAEHIQGLCRTPEGVHGLLPPSGPLTAVWVPLTLLRDPDFQQQYLDHHKSGPLIQAALRLMDFRGGDGRDATDTHRLLSRTRFSVDAFAAMALVADTQAAIEKERIFMHHQDNRAMGRKAASIARAKGVLEVPT